MTREDKDLDRFLRLMEKRYKDKNTVMLGSNFAKHLYYDII